MTTYSNESAAGNLDVAESGSEVTETDSYEVVDESVELVIEDEVGDGWFEPAADCDDEPLDEVDEEVDVAEDLDHDEHSWIDGDDVECEYAEGGVHDNGAAVGMAPSKMGALRETLLRTRSKVTGLFVPSNGDGVAHADCLELSAEFDPALTGEIGEDDCLDEEELGRLDHEGQALADNEADHLMSDDEGQESAYISEQVCNGMVETLQSDAELDAEVAAAIEVTSLLDAVALLEKFDKELAEVESVLCAD